MYSSDLTEEIFQRTPAFSKPSRYKLKSWTDTIEGYLNEAKQLTFCILKNRRLLGRPYSWFLTIYIRKQMSAKDAAFMWTKACRNLRRHGIIALWVREPTKRNTIHYHLLVQNDVLKRDLEKIIEASMPSRKDTDWHKKIMANDDRVWLPYYITKAKIKGTVRGKSVSDKYAPKRLLFKPGLGLRKFGTIGPFWLQSKQEIWRKVQETERRIAEGLSDARVCRLARHAFEFLDGHIPLNRIKRSFGYWAHAAAIQDWIESLSVDNSLGNAP